MRRRSFFAWTAGAFVALAGPARAHAMLVRAEPAVGATVRTPVTELHLRFSERIEPALCRLSIEDGAAHVLAVTGLTAEDDGRTLVGRVPALTPGVYRVRWRAVSVDTHITQGDYAFTIAP